MNIPTKRIELPHSGYQAEVKEYLGFYDLMSMAQVVKESNLEAAKIGIDKVTVHIWDKEKEIDRKEFLDNMHIKDGLALANYVNSLEADLKGSTPKAS